MGDQPRPPSRPPSEVHCVQQSGCASLGSQRCGRGVTRGPRGPRAPGREQGLQACLQAHLQATVVGGPGCLRHVAEVAAAEAAPRRLGPRVGAWGRCQGRGLGGARRRVLGQRLRSRAWGPPPLARMSRSGRRGRAAAPCARDPDPRERTTTWNKAALTTRSGSATGWLEGRPYSKPRGWWMSAAGRGNQ